MCIRDRPYIVYDAEKGAYTAVADKRGHVLAMPYDGGAVEVRSSRDAYLSVSYTHLDVYKRQG